EIGRLYDKLARLYDVWGRLTESRARNRAIELAEIKNGSRILEVAVGTGLGFYEIVKRNPEGKNIGIDLSQGMLNKAEKRLRKLSGVNYKLSIGTAFKLPIEDEAIDVLMNSYMFDLMTSEDADRVLSEFKRVLKKDGRLVLVNMTVGERLGSHIYNSIYSIYPRLMGGCRGVSMSGKLTDYGFSVEKREYTQQLLFPSEVILAHKVK
ncbi:MAG: methyltransferase domain-containing protein, partial [Syntrophales bacterium]|nr:methyltransferase domain-containing protein [Syntrophales bacterium]